MTDFSLFSVEFVILYLAVYNLIKFRKFVRVIPFGSGNHEKYLCDGIMPIVAP